MFTMAEMVAAFDISRVSGNAARFDLKKAEAINAAHLRALPVDEFARRVEPYLAADGVIAGTPTERAAGAARRRGPAGAGAQRRAVRRGARCCASCSSPRRSSRPSADAAEREPRRRRRSGARSRPDQPRCRCPSWSAAEIEGALKAALVDGLGLKPRKAFAPVRVAVSGRTVSPPLYESMELLGRERSLRRLRAGLERAASLG